MRFTTEEIAQVTGGDAIGPASLIDRASIDSREIDARSLFVPLRAERDGHQWIEAAFAAGASATLTESADAVPAGSAAVVVADTAAALTALGRAARDRMGGTVVGITGSVGKTSVKDLAAAAIGASRVTHASVRSFNNELGVPLTLIAAPDDADVVLVEMGARGAGHIRDLCAIARPGVGVVTWVGAAHTSEFGDVAGVAAAKAELIEALPSSGTAVLNADCVPAAAMSRVAPGRVLTYGHRGGIRIAGPVVLDAELRPQFDVAVGDRVLPVRLSARGQHQAVNAAGAMAIAAAVGADLDAAAGALARAALSPWRMEVVRTATGALVINDAYNANAISTEAALRSLAAVPLPDLQAWPHARRIAVLGVMAELGDRHDADHLAMAELCGELDIELIAFDESAYGVEPVTSFEDVLQRIGPLAREDAVLVKGSRIAGLEHLADRLTAA